MGPQCLHRLPAYISILYYQIIQRTAWAGTLLMHFFLLIYLLYLTGASKVNVLHARISIKFLLLMLFIMLPAAFFRLNTIRKFFRKQVWI